MGPIAILPGPSARCFGKETKEPGGGGHTKFISASKKMALGSLADTTAFCSRISAALSLFPCNPPTAGRSSRDSALCHSSSCFAKDHIAPITPEFLFSLDVTNGAGSRLWSIVRASDTHFAACSVCSGRLLGLAVEGDGGGGEGRVPGLGGRASRVLANGCWCVSSEDVAAVELKNSSASRG